MQLLDWQALDAAGRRAALARAPALADESVLQQARDIIARVRSEGDAALRAYARQFGGVEPGELRVAPAEFAEALASLPAAALDALRTAIDNVRTFHRAQLPAAIALETQPGVRCERVWRPLRSVGLYVPAGTAPLPSTAIMLAVPAGLAGCPRRILCTPARADGRADAGVLAAARLCGIDTVFKVGGAQAIAALAYGTGSIPKVDKIFGPGNRWVTAAKQLVAADPAGAALDLPAGPSEVCVIADDSADADYIAADLLAQAEHDALAQAILLTDSAALAQRVHARLGARAARLARQAVLAASLEHLRLIVVPDLPTAAAVAEDYAPEHLLLQTRAPRALLASISTAGSVFLGAFSPEPLGDYCSGTNHVLPTYGHARACSGLSVTDFMRSMTVQELSAEGLQRLGPVAVTLARLEGLDAHAAAVEARLASLAAATRGAGARA
ncbi:MAG TPA: histidinol dehydrogenase [Steroidobacteraceae bacterium]|nr:histidinol dehydrogenase [Steroidobacteraceae bacterium]